ncbi:DNA oxidative demethylase ALKBH2-like [Pieris napi]|uniref:DNA oxidative demethylase ALKBH2-like n=1 Tax=Pieris napi TaxID=78633 RepID=UPI001FB94E0E|nr:DNA oxidative demethylase ALKBH2-like [Pieris napi]XP_047505530.1 DNA oxidative demethylase ALKBH2-like [Pieris napi]
MAGKLKELIIDEIAWKSIKNDGLDIEYSTPIPRALASAIIKELDETLEYFTGDLAKIRVFGKIYPLPRQQVAYGDPGITYTYSNLTVPALPWPDPVLALRNFIFRLKGIKYNFVLVNKYRNGNDHMGEHRDNEPELDHNVPIASLSFGEERTFVLKHRDARKSGPNKKPIPPVSIALEHGSVLLMNPPTNEFWYHSLPKRKKIRGPRINLTFRKIR